MIALPVAVIILTIIVQYNAGKMNPYAFLVSLIELGFLAWSMSDFYAIYKDQYEYGANYSIGIQTLRARAMS